MLPGSRWKQAVPDGSSLLCSWRLGQWTLLVMASMLVLRLCLQKFVDGLLGHVSINLLPAAIKDSVSLSD